VFPGIEQGNIIQAEYTLQHGITPGICTIQIRPQGRLRLVPESLEFRFGDLRLRFPGCRIDASHWLVNENERRMQLTILDRRWAW